MASKGMNAASASLRSAKTAHIPADELLSRTYSRIMQGPMIMDNPYAAEVITVRQRIGRLKERLAHRAAARREFFADGAKTEDTASPDDQACSLD